MLLCFPSMRNLARCSVASISLIALSSAAFLGSSVGGCVPSFADTLAELADGSAKVSVDFEMHLERFDTRSGKFHTLPAPPTKRNLFTVGAAAGKVVVVGGLDNDGNYVSQVDVYDPGLLRWNRGAPWKRAHTAYSVVVGDLMCFFGGAAGADAHLSRDMDCYDALADAWTARAPVPDDVGGGLYPVAHGGKIYLLGSTKFDSKNLVTPLATAYSYDPKNDTWAKVAQPPSSRGGAGVVPYNDKLYVLAGFSKPSEQSAPPDSEMLVYDPSSDTWATGPQMPGRGIGFGVDALSTGPAAYFGLLNPALHHYDVSKKTWIAGKEPERDFDAGVYTSVVHEGNLYVLVVLDKAHSNRTESSGKLWKYDAAKDAWSIVGTRSPDSRDALFYGAPVGDSLFFVGAFTNVRITKAAAPQPDAGLVDASGD